MNNDPRLQNMFIRRRFFNAIEGNDLALADRIRKANSDLFTQAEESDLNKLMEAKR